MAKNQIDAKLLAHVYLPGMELAVEELGKLIKQFKQATNYVTEESVNDGADVGIELFDTTSVVPKNAKSSPAIKAYSKRLSDKWKDPAFKKMMLRKMKAGKKKKALTL